MSIKTDQTLFSVVAHWVSPFKNAEKLTAALSKSDSRAIAWVLEQTEYPIKQFLRSLGLPLETFRDIQHDGVIILIDKIKNKAYDPHLAAPTTYVIGICKYLIMNILRSKKEVKTVELEADYALSDAEHARYQSAKEMEEMLDLLLEKLGAPCNELIRLKYLEGYRDDEIIELKLTHYVSGDSLRNSRSQCMKRLSEMAKKMQLNP